MNHRVPAQLSVAGFSLAVVVLAPAFTTAQAQTAAAKPRNTAKVWTPPRTPDGQPDLQGFWTNSTLTPLERPGEFGGKQVLTAEEAAEYQKRLREQTVAAIDASWFERGEVVAGRRTSLIVDPPDGRIPPLTP